MNKEEFKERWEIKKLRQKERERGERERERERKW